MAIDLNFKNHQFNLSYDQSGLNNIQRYYCLICGIEILFTDHFEFVKYHFRPVNQRNILKQMTCEEIQIKKLLE